jgi:dipeptidyl aminopeptidase/acylaminoacyl peptidase
MVSPLTDRWSATTSSAPQQPSAPPGRLPAEVRRAVTEIAAATGAWCPALSPAGDRVAYVTDRSGIPRLEVATVGGTDVAVVLSGPTEEVVSVAWSPDGGWLAYLVSPGGSICAELHVVRPDGTGHRVIAGKDPRATVFAGGWTGPGHYVCSIAPGDGPDADIVLVDAATGGHRTLARGGFLSVTSVSADERFVLARRGPRAYRHIVVIDLASGAQRPVLDPGAPGGLASEDGRFAPDGRSLFVRASLPGEPFTDRAGLVQVPLTEDGIPGAGRTVVYRPDADLDGYALRTDGTVLAVWTADGITELQVHALSDGALIRQIALPEPVMPGWSLAADGRTMVAELTGPLAPRGLWHIPLDGGAAPATLPSAPPRPDPAVLVTPVRYDYVAPDGMPLSGWLYTPRGVRWPNRTVVSFHGGPEGQERPDWSPVAQGLVAAGFTVFAPNVRGSGGFGRAFLTSDDGPAREASFEDVRTTVDALVAAGVAEPGRIGAHGWSYGGYLTLVALTRWPGPSPITTLDRLTSPVLFVHGDRDTNVPVAESVQAHQALQALGAPSDLLLLPGEGHTIVGRDHQVELSGRVAAWFDRWL